MSKTSENNYYLNIHHRAIAINVEQNSGIVEQSFSPGHFYVSLQKNADKTYFGKYSQGGSIFKTLFSKAIIHSREEELQTNELEKLEKETGEEYHFYKSIVLTKERYDVTLDYALAKMDGRIASDNYILAINDCTDFVQEVYHEAGLPLYFTTAFKKSRTDKTWFCCCNECFK